MLGLVISAELAGQYKSPGREPTSQPALLVQPALAADNCGGWTLVALVGAALGQANR